MESLPRGYGRETKASREAFTIASKTLLVFTHNA